MTPDVRRARAAVAVVFLANGAGLASWVPHIPMVQATLGLGPSVLGVALLSMAAGSLVGIPLSGRATARVGSRRAVQASAAVFFAALALPVLAPSLPALVAALVVLGASNGALDVAMNAQAVAVESRLPRPVMSALHGMWSIGGFIGAGLATLALRVDVVPRARVLAAAVVFGAAALVASRLLLGHEADVRGDGQRFARPTGALAHLGVVAFLALVTEGAMGDWSAVYLRQSLGTSASTAALGFTAFSLTMATGRLLGDALAARVGDGRLLRTSTAGAALGLGAALWLAHPAAAIAGFAAVGFGIANLVPIVFRTAAALPGAAASQHIAAVGTAGYVGLLAGPPVIGCAAELVTLPAALGLVVAALAWIAVGSRVGVRA